MDVWVVDILFKLCVPSRMLPFGNFVTSFTVVYSLGIFKSNIGCVYESINTPVINLTWFPVLSSNSIDNLKYYIGRIVCHLRGNGLLHNEKLGKVATFFLYELQFSNFLSWMYSESAKFGDTHVFSDGRSGGLFTLFFTLLLADSDVFSVFGKGSRTSWFFVLFVFYKIRFLSEQFRFEYFKVRISFVQVLF